MDLISYLGIFVFSVAGALKARNHKLDILGSFIIAFLSAYGGGTIRDLIIGRDISWLNNNLSLIIVFSGILFVYLLNSKIIKYEKYIIIFDAIGLGLFTIIGIDICLAYDINIPFSIIFGTITASFGGLLADVLCNRIPDILKTGEVYATGCLLGGIIYVLLKNIIPIEVAFYISIIIVVFIRLITKMNNWKIPII